MSRDSNLRHEFVTSFPKELEQGILYVSMEYATAAHLCCCGCGNKVITPLSPKDWQLLFDGETVSLHPSIGNWSFPCQSHYWIRHGQIQWAPQWSKEQIEANRQILFSEPPAEAIQPERGIESAAAKKGFWAWLKGLMKPRDK